ncbi:MAG: signal peptidase I [Rickettsiaceae bacterium]|nr:signal peptidase I [Rickettsiaceae bacterium]
MTESSQKSTLFDEIKSLLVVVAIAMAIRILIIELFFVPTGSMKLTILEGDYIFATKYSYGYSKYSIPWSPNLFSGRIFSNSPERGDIIILKPPHDIEKDRYIKRLIGLPGDVIKIIDDVLYINNVPVTRQEVGEFADEWGKIYIKYKETLPNGVSYFSYKVKRMNLMYDTHSNYEPITVPQGHYFFMGDNRDESGDSRAQLGMVPFENLIAKAQFILFSTKEFLFIDNISVTDQILRVWTWLSEIRFNRTCASLYIQND